MTDYLNWIVQYSVLQNRCRVFSAHELSAHGLCSQAELAFYPAQVLEAWPLVNSPAEARFALSTSFTAMHERWPHEQPRLTPQSLTPCMPSTPEDSHHPFPPMQFQDTAALPCNFRILLPRPSKTDFIKSTSFCRG